MSIYDSEYTCPNCGAILNDQYGFDPDNGSWTCTSCGQTLYGDDVYEGAVFEGVMWCCDNCGALLNKQSGFYDGCGTWSCTECYHTNNISEDEIYDSEEDYQSKKSSETNAFDSFIDLLGRAADAINIDDEDDECDDDECEDEHDEYDYDNDDSEQDDSAYYYQENMEKDDEIQRLRARNKRLQKENRKIKNEDRKRLIRKQWKAFFIGLGAIVLVGFIAYQVSEYKKLIPVGMSSEDMKGLHYEEVSNHLKVAGFLNVRLEKLDDLKIEDEKEDGMVEQVVIDDEHAFNETKKFSYEDEVVVRYHSVRKINSPISSENAEGKDYKEIVKKFEKAGFVNVKTKPIYDLIIGWLTEDGEVEEVLIDGDNDVTTYSSFRPDAEVIVRYHTFKKNKE